MNSLAVPKFNQLKESEVKTTIEKVFIDGKYKSFLGFKLIEPKK